MPVYETQLQRAMGVKAYQHDCAPEFDLICYENWLIYCSFIERQNAALETLWRRVGNGLQNLPRAESIVVTDQHLWSYNVIRSTPYVKMVNNQIHAEEAWNSTTYGPNPRLIFEWQGFLMFMTRIVSSEIQLT